MIARHLWFVQCANAYGDPDEGGRNPATAERPPLRTGDLSRFHRAWSGREKTMGEPLDPLPLMARVAIFLRPVRYLGMGRMIGCRSPVIIIG